MTKKIGKRRTDQRESILTSLFEARRPLTVKEIHDLAQRRINKLGIATVYRTLKLLLEEGVILSLLFPDGETRYESATLGHHHHFKCLCCGKVFDLPHCPLPIPPGTTLPNGFSVSDHEVILYGHCESCVISAPSIS